MSIVGESSKNQQSIEAYGDLAIVLTLKVIWHIWIGKHLRESNEREIRIKNNFKKFPNQMKRWSCPKLWWSRLWCVSFTGKSQSLAFAMSVLRYWSHSCSYKLCLSRVSHSEHYLAACSFCIKLRPCGLCPHPLWKVYWCHPGSAHVQIVILMRLYSCGFWHF